MACLGLRAVKKNRKNKDWFATRVPSWHFSWSILPVPDTVCRMDRTSTYTESWLFEIPTPLLDWGISSRELPSASVSWCKLYVARCFSLSQLHTLHEGTFVVTGDAHTDWSSGLFVQVSAKQIILLLVFGRNKTNTRVAESSSSQSRLTANSHAISSTLNVLKLRWELNSHSRLTAKL